MAARFRKIDPRTWDDEKFIELPAGQKLIAIYTITAQSNRIGLFRFSHGMAVEHLKLDPETFRKGFANVCQTLGWGFDEARRVVYIPTWWKYNTPENPNVLKSCLSDLHEIPQTPLLKDFAINTEYLPDSFHETFAKGLGKQSRKQEQEKEQEKNTPQPPQAGENGSAAKRRRSPKGDLGDDLPGFLSFWSEFPDCERKVDRAGCVRCWRRDELESVAEQVIAGLRRWKVSESWAKDRGQFIPLPKTFLGQKRWEAPPARNGHVSELGPAEPLVVHRNL